MDKHSLIKKYVEGIVKNYSHSLIILGQAGYGKSYTTIATLKEMGYKDGQNFIYVANYLTPKAVMETLKKTTELNDPKILVIDEAENTLKDIKTIGVLKSALWEVDGQRKVFWITSKEYTEFNFDGKIIFIFNQLNRKSSVVKALIDRSLFFEIKLTKEEILGMMYEKIKNEYKEIPFKQKEKIIEVLKGFNNLSLRSLEKGIQLFRLSPHHYLELLKNLTNE